MPRTDRILRGVLVFGLVASGACTSSTEVDHTPSSPVVTTSSGTPPQVNSLATLDLRLFVDGAIVAVTDGKETALARWPSTTAPYEPPVEARHGFVGLTYARRGQALWYVTAKGARRLASPVSQGFVVSALGTYVAFGKTDLTSRRGSTHLVLVGGPGFARVEAETSLPNVHAVAWGFVGPHVFVGWGDGAAVSLGIWNPASGTVTKLPAYTRAGPTDQEGGRVVLFQGDGGCWGITTWPARVWPSRDPGADCNTRPMAFSPSGCLLAGISGTVDSGFAGGPRNRVLVTDATDTRTVFRSPPMPGAFQAAWEDESRLLVLAREQRGGGAVLWRCDLDLRRCERVWALEGGSERYGTWIVPKSPSA
ncbi:MAG: hypothetical protein AB1551_06105 [Actinomycetota bacterium]